jgi:hypothetical protein
LGRNEALRMAVNKGDLVKIEFARIDYSELDSNSTECLKSVQNAQELFLVTSSPYENQVTQNLNVHPYHRSFAYTNILICVDLIFKNVFLKSIPVKYLKRIT